MTRKIIIKKGKYMPVEKTKDGYVPVDNFEIGDDVIINWMTKTEVGKVISKPIHAFSILDGGRREVLIEFEDGRKGLVWVAIVNKWEKK